MKFTIEIYATAKDGSESLLSRTTISTIAPLGAQKKAAQLLAIQKKATGARVLNMDGKAIYEIGD